MRIFQVLFLLAVIAIFYSFERKDGSVSKDISTVDYTISAFPVGMTLYTVGERQYVAYYDSLHQMSVAMRTLPDGSWKYVKLDEKIGWDAHNSVTMKMDNRGVMHLVGNMHASPLVYFRTDSTGDISTFKRVDRMTGMDEDHVTYPSFLNLSDGRLLFHYRIGGSGNGNEIYDVLDNDGIWRRFLDKPLTDGRGLMNAYMQEPKLGPDGNYHLIWVWRDTPDCSTNHDLSYAYSPDLKHWKNIEDKDVALPINSLDKSLVVDPAQPGEGMINGGQRLGFDSSKRPLISYHKYDSDGNIQIYIARFENGHWASHQLTHWNYRWEFKGNGAISFELNMGAVKMDKDRNILVGYKRTNFKTGENWSRYIVVDSRTLEAKGEKMIERSYPEWIDSLECRFSPDMSVRTSFDKGDGHYLLRWESLPANRDRKPERALPPASPLKVIRFK